MLSDSLIEIDYPMTNEFIDSTFEDSITTLTFDSWIKCVDYMNRDKVLDAKSLVWRGHASEDWLLEPTLDRLIKKNGLPNTNAVREEHLERFRYASRGRRGPNPPELKTAEWWALGQHHGLATPLLDWTTSPYVAAYFAFANPDVDQADKSNPMRVVIGIVQSLVTEATDELNANKEAGKEPQVINFYEPFSNENPRLVNQGGLFTNSSVGINIEEWIKAHCKPKDRTYAMVKMRIPETERETCLRSLNRMNINHLSLFPDMDGACKYADLELTIKHY